MIGLLNQVLRVTGDFEVKSKTDNRQYMTISSIKVTLGVIDCLERSFAPEMRRLYRNLFL